MPAALRVLVRPQRARRLVAAGTLVLAGVLLPAGAAYAGVLAPRAAARRTRTTSAALLGHLRPRADHLPARRGLLLYSALKFRAKKGAVAAQIHGNTRLEVGWTIGAALLLVVIATVTFLKLPGIENPPNSGAEGIPVTKGGAFVAAGAKQRLPPNGKSLNILVNGQQYIWRYTYRGRRRQQPQQRLQLPGDGRSDEHDRHARDPRAGRRPLMVDPEARRQVRPDPRLDELHVVQGRARGASSPASAPSSAAATTPT